MSESLQILSKVLPQLLVIALICIFIGWSLRGRSHKAVQGKSAKPQPAVEKGADRAKNLEASLEKSRASLKSLKAEMEQLQSTTVSKSLHESATAGLEAAQKSLESETKRVSALESDLRKSLETIRSLNARTNGADKAQKDRTFGLENELSKARQELAVLQGRPDDSTNLHLEIARLKESVAVSTRYAGEVRKREAAAVEALEKAHTQLATLADPSRPAATVSKKVGPVIDSGRIAAAKAEVLRLVEMNRQKAATEVAAPLNVERLAAAAVEISETVDAPAPVAEEIPQPTEEAALVTLEEAPAVLESPQDLDQQRAVVNKITLQDEKIAGN